MTYLSPDSSFRLSRGNKGTLFILVKVIAAPGEEAGHAWPFACSQARAACLALEARRRSDEPGAFALLTAGEEWYHCRWFKPPVVV